jgi:hypothetical protein
MLIRAFLFPILIILGLPLADFGSQASEVNLKVQISARENRDGSSRTRYSEGEEVLIKVSMTNESADDVTLAIGQAWRYIRPRLKRNGEIVAYKEEMQNLLKEGSPLYSPVVVIWLKPRTTSVTDELNLEEWYDKFEAGHYQLSIERGWNGRGLISNTIEFDVIY